MRQNCDVKKRKKKEPDISIMGRKRYRKWLLEGVESNPPPGTHIKGIPYVMFESFDKRRTHDSN